MKIYIVNLKHRTDRKQHMLDQFKKHNITDYEFIEAIDGSKLDIESTGYDEIKASKILRPLSRNEIACAMSHNIVYRRILNSGVRSIIMEDDCTLTEDFAKFVSLDLPESLDLVFLGYSTSNREQFDVKKTFDYEIVSRQLSIDNIYTRTYFKTESVCINGFYVNRIDDQSYKNDFVLGTYAYSPSLHMCSVLQGFNFKPKVSADMMWNVLHQYNYHLNLWAPLIPIINTESFASDIGSDSAHIIKNQFTIGDSPYMKRITSEMYNI